MARLLSVHHVIEKAMQVQQNNIIIHREIIEKAHNCPFCKTDLKKLAKEIPQDEKIVDTILEQTIAAEDDQAFSAFLFAALIAEIPVDARHLEDGLRMLPHGDLIPTVAIYCKNDVAGALIKATETERLAYEYSLSALLFATLFYKQQNVKTVPDSVLLNLRRLEHQTSDNDPLHVFIEIIAHLLLSMGIDPHLKMKRKQRKKHKAIISSVISNAKRDVLDYVPESPKSDFIPGKTIHRSVQRIGRNEPCPCGSGKKYKQCCMTKDKERLRHSTQLKGVSFEDLKNEPEKYINEKHLKSMIGHELVKLNPEKVPRDLRALLVDRLIKYNEIESIAAFFEKFGIPEYLHEVYKEALFRIAGDGKHEYVKRLLKVRNPESPEVRDEDLFFGVRMLLEQENNSELLPMIETEAKHCLEIDDPQKLYYLADGLLDREYQGLGILLSRAALLELEGEKAEELLQYIRIQRDKLRLFSQDPIEEIYNQRFLKEDAAIEEADYSEELADAHENLQSKDQQINTLRDDLDSLRKELTEMEENQKEKDIALATTTTEDKYDAAAVKELQQRLSQLKSELKDRHNEKNTLKKDLVETRQKLAQLIQRDTEAQSKDDHEDKDTENALFDREDHFGRQPVRIPVFPKGFFECLKAFPASVARSALRLIGALAAGDDNAFSGSRRLRRNRTIIRQRVGINFRLLFKINEPYIEIIDLINRQDLETKIKSLA